MDSRYGDGGKHLSSLSNVLWDYKCLRQYTDLTIFCCDGSLEIHKALLVAVLKTEKLGMVMLNDTETLIVPGVTLQEMDETIKQLYLETNCKPFLNLLNFFAPVLDPNVPYTPEKLSPRKREKKMRNPDMEYWDDNLSVSDLLNVTLKETKPIKIEPKYEGFQNQPPAKIAIPRLNPKTKKTKVVTPGRGRGKKFSTQCPHCQMIITGKKSFKRHLRNTHQMVMPRDGEEVQCQVCGKTLKHMQILKTHMKEVHGDRSFTCNLCGLTLSCQRNLTTHMISHTTPSIPCDQCGKLFKRKYAVKNHIKKFHMQIKEKICDQCDKSFADARHLREHVLAIHEKLKPFGCEVCDFKCARIDNLNTHRKKSHGMLNKLTRAEHDEWVIQGKHPFVKTLIGGADVKNQSFQI